MTIEENLSKLSQIVTAMEQGDLTLEESLEKYEEGVRLVRSCNAMIDHVEKRIQILEEQDEDI